MVTLKKNLGNRKYSKHSKHSRNFKYSKKRVKKSFKNSKQFNYSRKMKYYNTSIIQSGGDFSQKYFNTYRTKLASKLIEDLEILQTVGITQLDSKDTINDYFFINEIDYKGDKYTSYDDLKGQRQKILSEVKVLQNKLYPIKQKFTQKKSKRKDMNTMNNANASSRTNYNSRGINNNDKENIIEKIKQKNKELSELNNFLNRRLPKIFEIFNTDKYNLYFKWVIDEYLKDKYNIPLGKILDGSINTMLDNIILLNSSNNIELYKELKSELIEFCQKNNIKGSKTSYNEYKTILETVNSSDIMKLLEKIKQYFRDIETNPIFEHNKDGINYKIYKLENVFQAIKLGKNTKWCTSILDIRENMFHFYDDAGDIYTIIIKGENIEETQKQDKKKYKEYKFQFQFEKEEFMNALNNTININVFFYYHRFIYNFFKTIKNYENKGFDNLPKLEDIVSKIEDNFEEIDKIISDKKNIIILIDNVYLMYIRYNVMYFTYCQDINILLNHLRYNEVYREYKNDIFGIENCKFIENYSEWNYDDYDGTYFKKKKSYKLKLNVFFPNLKRLNLKINIINFSDKYYIDNDELLTDLTSLEYLNVYFDTRFIYINNIHRQLLTGNTNYSDGIIESMKVLKSYLDNIYKEKITKLKLDTFIYEYYYKDGDSDNYKIIKTEYPNLKELTYKN